MHSRKATGLELYALRVVLRVVREGEGGGLVWLWGEALLDM